MKSWRYRRTIDNHQIAIGANPFIFTVIPTIHIRLVGTKAVSVEWLSFYAMLRQAERPDEYYFPVFGNH